MALTVNKSIIRRQAEKENLTFWQIFSGSAELWRQDENLSFEDSFNELEQALEELAEGSRPGEAVIVAMQNMASSAAGRTKGQKLKRFNYTLSPSNAGRAISGGISADHLKLVDKVARMEEAEKWRAMNEKLEQRLEKLENDEGGKTAIGEILNHPMAQMALSALLGKAAPIQGTPINGTPDDSQQDINYLCAHDNEFKTLLHAVRLIHEHDAATYAMSSKMIIDAAKKYL